MFIRYNPTLKFWEYDTSAEQTGAGPWATLPVDISKGEGGQLPANIAYIDKENKFVAKQTIDGGLRLGEITGQSGIITWARNDGAPDARKWHQVMYPDGSMRFYPINDAENAATKNGIQLTLDGLVCDKLTTLANAQIGQDHSQAALQTTYPIYPGNEGAGWKLQGQWWLGSHPSFGLYSNTSMRLEGIIQPAAGMNMNYLQSSNAPQDFNIETDGGWGPAPQYSALWTRIGGMMHIQWMCHASNIYHGMMFRIPNNQTAQRYAQGWCLILPDGYPPTYGARIEIAPNDIWVKLYYNQGGAPGAGRYSGQIQVYVG